MTSVRQQTNRGVPGGVVGRAVLAVVLAFAFWAWVTSNNNPDRRRDFPDVPVTAINQPDGLAITDSTPQKVTVSIWGPQSIVSSPALQAGNFAAVIDLKGLKPGTQQAPIRVNTALEGLRKKRAEPADAQVTLEQRIEKTLPVTAPTRSQSGIKVNSVTAAPQEVQVSGPESKVRAVAQVVANLDIGNRTTNFQSTVDVKAVDASDKEVTGLTLSPARVTVTVDITDLRNERPVPVVTPNVTGTPATGFQYIGTNVTPDQVTLMGDPQTLRTIPNIPTESISIDGLKQTTTVTAKLDTSKLPPGITVKDNVTTVRVQINIAEITSPARFRVAIKPVNLKAGLQSLLSQSEATITLRGTREQLDQIGSNLTATVDLSAFAGPGTKTTDVNVQLPSGSAVTIEGIDPAAVQVTVTAVPTPTPIPPTATPRPTATATPLPTATATPQPTATPG